MVIITCAICGKQKEVINTQAHQATCSPSCSRENLKIRWEKQAEEKIGEPLPHALRRMYVDEKMSTTRIAQELQFSGGAGQICRLLRRYGIPTRTIAESVSMSWEGNEDRRKKSSEWARKMAVQYYELGVDTRAKQYRQRPGTWEQLTIDYLTERHEPFEFQIPFGVYILDFILTDRNLCLEIDSGHHSIEHIKERDERRDAAVREIGLIPERLLAQKLLSPGVFFARLQSILERHPSAEIPTGEISHRHDG